MKKEAIEKIQSLVEKSLTVIDIEGRQYLPQGVVQICEPVQKKLEVRTLDGLVDFIKSGIDRNKDLPLTVHVLSPTAVNVYMPIMDDSKERPCLIQAVYDEPEFPFERHISQEAFVIGLQAKFLPEADRAKVLAVVGNITAEASTGSQDDGVSQTVTAKAGVTRVENVELPNPVKLVPRRFFSEVKQIESEFVLRIDSRLQVALFEADGGYWKTQAIDGIAEYLKEKFGDEKSIYILS